MKRYNSFTLFEIVLSIIIISLLYAFALNSFEFGKSEPKKSFDMLNLKKELLNIEYEKTIHIVCTENDLGCFIFRDGELLEQKIQKFFTSIPEVYLYNEDFTLKEYPLLELENLESYNVVFEYSCNKQQKCSESIVFAENKWYILNDIYTKPQILNERSDVENYFQERREEVKNAF